MLSTKEILDRIDMPDLLEKIGFDDVNPSKSTYLGYCIFHDDSATKSFYANHETKTFTCYGACSKRGNAIQLYAWWKNLSVEAAKVELSDLESSRSLVTLDRQLTVKEVVPLWRRFELLTAYAKKMPLITETPYRKYMNGRGISDATLDAFGVRGWKEIEIDEHEVASYVELGILKRRDNNIYDRFSEYPVLIPYTDVGSSSVTFLQGRMVENVLDKSKYMNIRGQCTHSYNHKVLYYARNSIMICEGAMDVFSAVELGFQNVIGIPGVSSFKSEWLDDIQARRVVLAFDADKAGDEAFKSLSEIIGRKGIEVVRFDGLNGAKDLNELLVKGIRV